MRGALKSWFGMIAIALVAVLGLGAVAVRMADTVVPSPVPTVQATPARTAGDHNLLVSADWLQRNRDTVTIIYDLSDLPAYDVEHIPGAVHLWWEDAMALHASNYGSADAISAPLGPDDPFGRLTLHIPRDATIVVYDNTQSERAAWFVWVLKLNGYDNAMVLDGGLAAWKGIGGETTAETSPAPTDNPTIDPVWHDEAIIPTDALNVAITDRAIQVIDVRDDQARTDTINDTIREGQIPGSIQITAGDVLRPDGTFYSPNELRQIFADHGITGDQSIAIYGTFGSDTGPVWLASQLAGLNNVMVYDAGYSEWGFREDLPIEPIGTVSVPATPSPTTTATPAATPVASPVSSPEASPAATPEAPIDLT